MYISFKKESCTDTEKNLFTMRAVNYKYNINNGVLWKKGVFTEWNKFHQTQS